MYYSKVDGQVTYGVIPEVDSPLFGVTSVRSSDDDPVS